MSRYSIIIPAYNEAEFLPRTLDSVFEAMKAVEAKGEVIVTDNNSTDRTSEIARERGATVVFEPKNQIARARNRSAAAASSDSRFFIFLDADTLLSGETLQKALDLLESGACCGGGATVKSDHPLPIFVAGILDTWNRMARFAGWAAGCFVFCRRDAFEEIGGFDERYYASEEVWFSNRLRQWGKHRSQTFRVLSDVAVVTSGRKADWFSSWRFLAQIFLLMINPWAVRTRNCCPMWYRRPQTKKSLP